MPWPAVTVHLIEGTTSPLAEKLYQTPPSPVSGQGKPLMFSGGIGYYYLRSHPARQRGRGRPAWRYRPAAGGKPAPERRPCKRYTILKPAETQRATVLGASAQTLTLSGSTIWADEAILPLKNVPVIRAELPPPASLTAPGDCRGQCRRPCSAGT